ncbi:MAG: hypothetical protein V7606_2212 [Burkholderiales bacterium]
MTHPASYPHYLWASLLISGLDKRYVLDPLRFYWCARKSRATSARPVLRSYSQDVWASLLITMLDTRYAFDPLRFSRRGAESDIQKRRITTARRSSTATGALANSRRSRKPSHTTSMP